MNGRPVGLYMSTGIYFPELSVQIIDHVQRRQTVFFFKRADKSEFSMRCFYFISIQIAIFYSFVNTTET
jgi:hypothetical protein